ncbi:class I SAM-dependent methyltransferase [Actinospica sp. MGRD01-02]|uniref:Class I SAM-dependent methyltransferase n=1 Tax=Actinospica acidithermotolerans TaxID=2828514 RepID=A0A941EGB6_9ACTN|nr:class I SAM-dependent methyltransferase [Actinospica acidithermotolerans]MBR7829987.1 class I SAM-dependent methyltransferase [Actinospica acidithermotolerans]
MTEPGAEPTAENAAEAGTAATAGADVVAGTQRAYTRIARRYAQRWSSASNPWIEAAADRFTAPLPAGALVADVGCGPGNDTLRLRERGLRVHGFDLSHAMLTARDVPGQVRADLRALPLADAALDGLWCVAVLLHIPRKAVPAALAEFHRVLRPGGHALITIAEGDGEGWEPYAHPSGADEAVERYFVYHAREAFAGLLAAAGFEILWTGCATTHRTWLSLHLRRIRGVH